MDQPLGTQDLIHSSYFASLSQEQKNEAIREIALTHHEDDRGAFMSAAGNFVQAQSRREGYGRVFNQSKVFESLRVGLPENYNELTRDQFIEEITKAHSTLIDNVKVVDPVTTNDTAYYAQIHASLLMQRARFNPEYNFDSCSRSIQGLLHTFLAPFDELDTQFFLFTHFPTDIETNAKTVNFQSLLTAPSDRSWVEHEKNQLDKSFPLWFSVFFIAFIFTWLSSRPSEERTLEDMN